MLLHALCHYVLRVKILADFNLAVSTLTAKLPNLIPCQIFRLYGICLYDGLSNPHKHFVKASKLNASTL